MPFITEALWGVMPHRESDPDLLIVARWPAPGTRDAAVEAEVGDLIALVTEIRNARATAKLPAGDWLETRVYVPRSMGAVFETLRPAIERLARARPLERELTPEALHGRPGPADLSVVISGTDIQAIVRPAAPHAEAADLERSRLERDLEAAEGHLAGVRARLADQAFMSKAPAAVVDGARTREAELTDQVERLRARLGR